MNTPNPKSSSVRQTESPEYMDVDGFEGFFYETKERRIVEFEDLVSESENIDGVDGVLDRTSDENLDSDSEDELLLLDEILNFQGEVGILTRVCQGERVGIHLAEFPYLVLFFVHVVIYFCPHS